MTPRGTIIATMRWLHPRNMGRCAAVIAAALLLVAPGLLTRPAAGNADNTVRLTVVYGDDAMKEATSRPHGISFSYTGAGDDAMLTKIDDVQNQGGGTGKKNWQFWVNGNYGDRSFATFELHAQDVVVWRFTTEQGK